MKIMKAEENISRQKKCFRCNALFNCFSISGHTCWCNDFPAIFDVTTNEDCLCPDCLKQQALEKINKRVDEYKEQKGVLPNPARITKQTSKLMEGIDYYIEKGNYVFTEWHHLKRGTCCKNGCRHCPYK